MSENNNNNQLQNSNNSYNGLSIAGFVLGIISCFLNFFGIVGIVAVVLSSIGLAQISRDYQKGKTLAITGIVLGAINIIFALFVFISFF
ncbi:DUF4190 domain-containing protein [Clostridium sp. D53t1_180928_C8]|uniref:DUF4190 domain-containing protein n=1 Tax=Clostridium sp. D53t1_180928_C8 TaxID=2787101 RepID=UPI0018AC226E|nr:DUF4190 domain-containing protein [Clostridium sp. D53t1_180928_C8]